MFLEILVILIVLFCFWGFLIEPNIIKVERLTIRIKNLPNSFNNLKIVHLTDTHLTNFGKKEKKVINIVSRLKPDLIVITGDIIDERTRDLKPCRLFFEGLSKNYQGKIFAVYGNHDHLTKKFEGLGNVLKENGVCVLDNESRKLCKGKDFIYLIGVDDPYLGYDDIDKATNGLEKNRIKILLAHSPDIHKGAKDKNISLILVGHAHGCQVNIPFLCNLFLPLRYSKKYKMGLFKSGSTYMYVNRGIGEVIAPVRINSFPEIGLIKLVSSN